MQAASLLPSILLGVLLAVITASSGRSSTQLRHQVWSPDVQVQIKDHEKKKDFRVAFNNRLEERADHCYKLNYNMHNNSDRLSWMIVRLENTSFIRQLNLSLAASQEVSESVSVEALVSDAKTLNFTEVSHLLHVITRFSAWDRFSRCGAQQLELSSEREEKFYNFTFVCDPPILGSYVALTVKGLHKKNKGWAVCEVGVMVPHSCDELAECVPGMCAKDAVFREGRCICPPGSSRSGYNQSFCSLHPGVHGCDKGSVSCWPTVVELSEIKSRSQLLTDLKDFLRSRDSGRASLKQQLTSADIRLLVPVMETAFPVNKSDGLEDVINSTLELCVGLSDQLLAPDVDWMSVEEANRLPLAMRAVETVENAGSSLAARLTAGASAVREASQVSVEILAPGRSLYQSSDLRGSRVNLSLPNASSDGLSVAVLSSAAFLPSILSDVVSVAPSPSGPVTVDLLFRRRRPGRPRCVFWSPRERQWSSSGCALVSQDAATALCRCRHLTSFALLLDVGWGVDSPRHRAAQRWISAVGGFASCLLLVYAVACFLALLRRQAWYFVDLHLSVSLLLAQLLLAVTAAAELPRFPRVCASVAVALHLLLLCVFAWALNQGVRMYLKLVRVLPTLLSHRRAMLGLGYGVPVLLMIVSVPLTVRDYGRSDACWMTPGSAAMWLFVVPAAAVMAANAGILVLSLVRIRCSPGQELRRSGRRKRLLNVSKLLFLMALLGLNWLFGFLVNVKSPVLSLVFSYAFIAVNLSTSLLICLGYRLFSLDVRLALLKAMDRRHMLYGPLKVYADVKGLGRTQKSSHSGPMTLGSAAGRHGMSERQGLSRSSDSKQEFRL